MTTTKHHSAGLRIFSKTLSVSEITAHLQAEPSRSFEKGTLVSPRNPKSTRREFTLWILSSNVEPEEIFHTHIESLLTFIENKIDKLEQLLTTCEIDIFCGLFAEDSGSIFYLDSKLLKRLTAIPIDLIIDYILQLSIRRLSSLVA
jgi:Domain of unknown function (DUF4279)